MSKYIYVLQEKDNGENNDWNNVVAFKSENKANEFKYRKEKLCNKKKEYKVNKILLLKEY